jgi:hypothetical protein
MKNSIGKIKKWALITSFFILAGANSGNAGCGWFYVSKPAVFDFYDHIVYCGAPGSFECCVSPPPQN